MLDVVLAIEAIAQINDEINVKELKRLASIIISDPYYLPVQQELLVLGHLNGISTKELAEYINRTPQSVKRYIDKYINCYSPNPKFSVDEDEVLLKFFKIVELFRKVGI